MKLQKPFAHTNKLSEAPPKAEPNLLTMPFLPLLRSQLQDRRGLSGQEVLTMKALAVLPGLITATLVSGKSGEGREGERAGIRSGCGV